MLISLKISSPSHDRTDWGDNAYARNLAKSFTKIGHEVEIHCMDQWDHLDPKSELIISVSGLMHYSPPRNKKSFMWLISHPEVHKPDFLNKYNKVFIASDIYRGYISQFLKVPSYYLPQVSDTDLFHPQPEITKDIDVLFVGNNYYDNISRRKVIDDVVNCGRNIDYLVVGKNWLKGVPTDRILTDFVEYSSLPELYSRAKISLNDHHELMRRNGFINNRTFDLAFLKTFQISDYVAGMENYGLITYKNSAELGSLIEYYLDNDKERIRNSEIVSRLTTENTFDYAAQQFLSQID
ncbi:MAG: glycosyltransferase [Candidatus Cloacimonetes bacterium]|nr:glycosyltransferase [Candidatus Cloacimonadota bacterium]